MHTMVFDIFQLIKFDAQLFTYFTIMVLDDLTKVNQDQLKIDMYILTSCDFHAIYFMMNLCHFVMSLLVIIDEF